MTFDHKALADELLAVCRRHTDNPWQHIRGLFTAIVDVMASDHRDLTALDRERLDRLYDDLAQFVADTSVDPQGVLRELSR